MKQRQVDPSDGSVLEVEYRNGLPWGKIKSFQRDNQQCIAMAFQALSGTSEGTVSYWRLEGAREIKGMGLV